MTNGSIINDQWKHNICPTQETNTTKEKGCFDKESNIVVQTSSESDQRRPTNCIIIQEKG